MARWDPPVRFAGALSSKFLNDKNKPKKLIFVPQVSSSPPYNIGNARLQAVKFWADGSTQGFTAALNADYLPDCDGDKCTPRGKGTPDYASQKDLENDMGNYLEKGWQLSVHANGDHAIDWTMDSYENPFKNNPGKKTGPNGPHRIEHFTVTTKDDQVPRAASLGLAASHTIGHVYYWGDTFRTNILGSPRAERVDPIREDATAGLSFTFNSDSPVTPVDPLSYVATAVKRDSYDTKGEVIGSGQCVNLETALRGITTSAAEQVMLGDTIGSLDAGKSADFVILNADPRSFPDLSDLRTKVNVVETWLQGRKAYPRSFK